MIIPSSSRFGSRPAAVALMWALLAAVLNPTAILPWVTGILTIFITVSVWFHWLQRSAEQLRHTIREEYAVQLRESARKITDANRKLQRLEARVKRGEERRSRSVRTVAEGNEAADSLTERVRSERAAGGAAASGADAFTLRAKGTTEADKNSEGGFDASAFFDVLDKDSSGYLSEREFFSLFEQLHVNVSLQQRAEMFAYSDAADGDGRIRREEFLEAWAWLEETMATPAALAPTRSEAAPRSLTFARALLLPRFKRARLMEPALMTLVDDALMTRRLNKRARLMTLG